MPSKSPQIGLSASRPRCAVRHPPVHSRPFGVGVDPLSFEALCQERLRDGTATYTPKVAWFAQRSVPPMFRSPAHAGFFVASPDATSAASGSLLPIAAHWRASSYCLRAVSDSC